MTGTSNKGRIFVIEDDPGMQSLLSDVFRSDGYMVTSFSEAVSALDQLTRADCGRVDAVVCDVNMPKLTGMDFLDRVNKGGFRIPVILITAFGTDRTAQEAFRKGAFGYLSKPFQLAAVDDLVKRAISSRGAS